MDAKRIQILDPHSDSKFAQLPTDILPIIDSYVANEDHIEETIDYYLSKDNPRICQLAVPLIKERTEFYKKKKFKDGPYNPLWLPMTIPALLASLKDEEYLRLPISELGLQTLTDCGIDINEKRAEDGYTPLHLACREGNEDLVQKLINAGAQIDIPNVYFNTPLTLAAYYKHSRIVSKLLAAHANPEGNALAALSPLMNAAINNNVEGVTLLIKAGAQVNKKSKGQTTALHCAARNGHFNVIKALLDAGADINSKNFLNNTALGSAARVIIPSFGAIFLRKNIQKHACF